MIKKLFYSIIAIMSSNILLVSAATPPPINCEWLPWCSSNWDTTENNIEIVTSNIISEMIKYVAVLAVIALMLSWIMYMISWWEEEKTKKAKSWIIWSLVAVLLSISSLYIVSTIAKININI
jgi:hypothetical protein